MKKPFFWFLIKSNVNHDLLSEFAKESTDNFGIAFSEKALEVIDPGILNGIHHKRIPIAINLITRNRSVINVSGIFSSIIYPYHKDTSLKKDEFFRFKLSNFQNEKKYVNELLDQLSAYFLFKGAYPKNDAIIELTNISQINNSGFFRLMQKLEIQNFIVPFSIKNVTLVKNILESYQKSSDYKKLESSAIFDLWRNQIDVLDNILIETLNQRMQIVSEMGDYKKQNDLPLFQPERWHEILKSRRKSAKTIGVDEELVSTIVEAIHLSALKKMIEIEMEK